MSGTLDDDGFNDVRRVLALVRRGFQAHKELLRLYQRDRIRAIVKEGADGALKEIVRLIFDAVDFDETFIDRADVAKIAQQRDRLGELDGGVIDQTCKLLRFIDCNVEPGTRYVYRVQAMLWNPNLGVEPRYLTKETLGDGVEYLIPNLKVKVEYYEGKPVSVELPPGVVMKVVEVEPGIKGGSVSNVGKPAKMETGLIVSVPQFVNEGDSIRVSTSDGSYQERVTV